MKNLKSKKGFSLIELIVVIAVIAAIAAIIVPSITNFSDAAKESADQRNIQLWNSTYKTIVAAGGSITDPANNDTFTTDDAVAPITYTGTVGSGSVTFTAAGFNIEGAGSYTFTTADGIK